MVFISSAEIVAVVRVLRDRDVILLDFFADQEIGIQFERMEMAEGIRLGKLRDEARIALLQIPKLTHPPRKKIFKNRGYVEK
jgi:hypothetical protein